MWAIAALLVVGFVHGDGDVLFLDASGNASLSQLAFRVIPGTQNSTSFRVVAQSGNISSLAFFAFSPELNITLSPSNRTLLPDGDFQLVTATASVANNTQAGIKVASIFVLTTKPQQLLLPLIVDVPSTTEWNVSVNGAESVTKNVTLREFGVFNVSLVNTGNIPISGHISVVDLNDLIFFDDSNFLLEPGEPVSRPLYYFVSDHTPGAYSARLAFVDSLQNARHIDINFTLPDTSPPELNISLGRGEIYPGQKVAVTVTAADDVNVSSVRWRLDTGDVFDAQKVESGKYSFELSNLSQLTVGTHDLVVLANDSAGNVATANRSFEVLQFRFLNASSQVDFLKFRPGQIRYVKVMTAISPVELNVTLKNMLWDNRENNTLQIAINGVVLEQGVPKAVHASGDVLLTAQAPNLTRFSGILEVQTPAEVFNPAPEISFRGEVANYSVTPAFNLSLPGFSSMAECVPREDTSYENSYLGCQSRFSVDTLQENVGVIGSPASLLSERQGYKTEIDTRVKERDGAILLNWLGLFIFISAVAGLAFKHYWWDQRMRVGGLRTR